MDVGCLIFRFRQVKKRARRGTAVQCFTCPSTVCMSLLSLRVACAVNIKTQMKVRVELVVPDFCIQMRYDSVVCVGIICLSVHAILLGDFGKFGVALLPKCYLLQACARLANYFAFAQKTEPVDMFHKNGLSMTFEP